MTTLPANDTQSTLVTPVRSINPWLVRIPLLFLLGGMLLAITLTVTVVLYQLSMMGRIAPGTSAFGVALGGKTPTEAAEALDATFNYDEMVFTFRYRDQFWQRTAGELGVRFDADATAQAALDASQGGSPAEALANQTTAWFAGATVQPTIVYDEAVAAQQLSEIAAEIGRPPRNATLTINGLDVVTTPAQSGIVLDMDTALAQLNQRIANMEPGGEIVLDIIEAEPLLTDVEATAAYIRTAVGAPLRLVANDADGNPLGPWTVSPEQVAAGLSVTLVTDSAGTPTYRVDVDLSAYAPQIEALAPGLIVPARNGRFTFDEATGTLQTLTPAVDKRRLNVQRTIERMEEAVFSVGAGSRTVELAFDYTTPQYHNDITAAELGITEMVSSSRTFYTGSTAARRQNIENAAAMYNGIIIPPGGVFSFNEIVGDISEENGFVEGAIIFGGRTVKGIGGGVCQVSTTAYRAAFFGGFPILERYSHGYRVYYYELGNAGPGLDAAIFTPTADMKFLNDTDYHLLIETEFMPDIDALEFRFYSTDPGRTVEVSEPIVRNEIPPTNTIYEANPDLQPGQQLQVDWSQTGGDVVVTRVIRDEQGNILERRDYGTYYQPWSAVIQVAPNDARLSQSNS